MKNKRNVLSLVLLLVAVLCFGVACKRDVPQKHEISFYIDAEKVTSLQTAGNEVLVLPNAPEKTDYSFDGWYFDEGVWQNKLTENTYKNQALNEDVSVYAYYLKNEDPKPVEQFTIEFKVNGKTFSTIKTAGNEKLSLPVAPEITGSNFIGWYFDENVWSQRLTETTYLNEKLTENKVVYAYYLKEEQNTYPVTFVTNGGTALESVTVSVLESAPETKREGFTFEGWYLDEEFQNKVQFPLTITQATTLYAKWKGNVP